jgi:hypothetical protein
MTQCSHAFGTGPTLCHLKKKDEGGRSIGYVAMIPFVCCCAPLCNTQNLPDVLRYAPLGEKVSTGAYILDTSDHDIIQGGDDVLHPLVSVVLVPGYNTPDKLTTFTWRYKEPYILQIDAFTATLSLFCVKT